MAKNRRKPLPPSEIDRALPSDAPPPKEPKPREKDSRFGIGAYVLMNVVFDLFCVAQLVLIQVTIKETRGLYFFFGLLMVGFLVVSVFDYLYDRFAPESESTES